MSSKVADLALTANRPRYYLLPNVDQKQDPVYDADAEYFEMEDSAEQLAEAYIVHNNARMKCNNLILPEAKGCEVCFKNYKDYYYVWRLSLKVKRFE